MIVKNSRCISFGAFSPSAIKELIQTQKHLYPVLSQKEWDCIETHLLKCYACMLGDVKLPAFSYQNIIEQNATYHDVHLNSFLAYNHRLSSNTIVNANRLYRWKGNYYISARLSLIES